MLSAWLSGAAQFFIQLEITVYLLLDPFNLPQVTLTVQSPTPTHTIDHPDPTSNPNKLLHPLWGGLRLTRMTIRLSCNTTSVLTRCISPTSCRKASSQWRSARIQASHATRNLTFAARGRSVDSAGFVVKELFWALDTAVTCVSVSDVQSGES